MSRLRKLPVALLVALSAVSLGCSMDASVDDKGDGVRVEGDVDKQKDQ